MNLQPTQPLSDAPLSMRSPRRTLRIYGSFMDRQTNAILESLNAISAILEERGIIPDDEPAHFIDFEDLLYAPSASLRVPSIQCVDRWSAHKLGGRTACSICLDEDGDKIATPCCGMCTHRGCALEWLSRRGTCPHCRVDLLNYQ